MQVINGNRTMQVLMVALVLLASSQQLLGKPQAKSPAHQHQQSAASSPEAFPSISTSSSAPITAPTITTPIQTTAHPSASPAPSTIAPVSASTILASTVAASLISTTIATPVGQILHSHSSEALVAEKLASSAGPKTIFDLSYPLSNSTLHWPANDGFVYPVNTIEGERLNPRNESYYLKSDGFTTAVHSGTHLDAPRHFSKSGWTVDAIPLDRLIDVPLHVIDLSAKVKANRSYEFTRDDFVDPKSNVSLVSAKSVVIVYTGISLDYANGAKAYFGTESKDITKMVIPGFSSEAAKYLVDMGVFGVGLDAPSADSSVRHGSNGTYDPAAHSVFNSNNVYILENVSNKLADVLNHQADIRHCLRLTVAPLPIVDGSGSPVRLVAISEPKPECPFVSNSASETIAPVGLGKAITSLIAIAAILII